MAQRHLDEGAQPGVRSREQEDSGPGRRRRRLVDRVLPHAKKATTSRVIEKNSRVGGLARTCYYSGHPVRVRSAHLVLARRRGRSDQQHDRQAHQRRAVLHRSPPVHLRRGRRPEVPLSGPLPGHRPDAGARAIHARAPAASRRAAEADRERSCRSSATASSRTTSPRRIGPTLYEKFMANYTWKMWNIPGDELETSMVWADRFRHAYTKSDDEERGARRARLRSAEVRGPHARQGHRVSGLSRSTAGTRSGTRWWRARPSSAIASSASATSTSRPYVLTASGEKYYFADYHTVFCSIDIDELWGEDTLPYTGRMMIPLLIPGLEQRVSRRRRVAALLVVRVPDARHRDEGHHAARQPRHADPDRGAGAARRGGVLSAEHDRLRARAQPVRREGVSAAVGAGVRDLPRATSIAAGRSRTCATSAATPSSSTGAWRKRSTPPIRRRSSSSRCDADRDPRVDHVAQAASRSCRRSRSSRGSACAISTSTCITSSKRGVPVDDGRAARSRRTASASGSSRADGATSSIAPPEIDETLRVGRSAGRRSRAGSASARCGCSSAAWRARPTTPAPSTRSAATCRRLVRRAIRTSCSSSRTTTARRSCRRSAARSSSASIGRTSG